MRPGQRGTALMLMLVIVVVGSLSLLVGSLGQAGLQTARDRKNSEALAEAKEALIAYAISSTRPGNLPCPDRELSGTSGYGSAEGTCASGSGTSIGRLPWKTLGIPELVDADGEPLWYMLSDNFRASASVINSDTPGTLAIYDNSGTTLLTPSAEVAAIVFAPGSPIGAQSRSATLSAPCTTTSTTIPQSLCAANYLDVGPNGRNNAAAGGPYIAASKTDTINDRLLYITTEDLFATLEKLVSKKIESGIKPMLNTYYSVWGAFPLAATFARPSTSTFTGQAAVINGLLPLGNILNMDPSPLWKTTPTATYAVSGGGDSGNCTMTSFNTIMHCPCNEHGCPNSISIPAGSILTLSGDVAGVGFGLWNMFDKEDLLQVAFEAQGSPGKKLYSNAALNLTNVSLSGRLRADGSATVTLSATAKSGGSSLKFIEMKGMQSSSTLTLASWLLPNNWHQLMYYAVTQGYAPGSYPPGGNTCVLRSLSPPANPPYYCLGVNGNGGGNNKQAIVVLMGKALAGKSHTTGSLADYLEGENVTPTDFIHENKTRSGTFNDQVVVVAP